MSAQWWHMKMQDTFVFAGGKYHHIENVRCEVDEDEIIPDGGAPEDVLEHMRFITDDGHRLKWDEFQIKQPDEEWKMLDGKAVFGQRTMVRAYKLAPYRDSFTLTTAGRGTILSYLNAPTPEYADSNTLFDWGVADCVFSPEMAAYQADDFTKYVKVGSTSILRLRRFRERQTFTRLTRIPDGLTPAEWVPRFDTEWLYDGPALPYRPELHLQYEWEEVEDGEPIHQYQWSKGTHFNLPCMRIGMRDDVYIFLNEDNLQECFDEEDEYYDDADHYDDIRALLVQGGIING